MPWLKPNPDGKRLPRVCLVLYGVGAFSLLLLLIACIWTDFADAFNGTVGAFFRALMAHLTSLFPFSLAELLLWCLPVLVVVLIVIAYRHYCDTWHDVWVYLGILLSAASVLLSVFVCSLGIGHRTHALDERLSLPSVEVTVDTLADTARQLIEELNAQVPGITYGEDGFSVMPYDVGEMNEKLLTAFEPICERYDFIQRLNSRIKPVMASRLMSYTHITGVYSFYTGEANLNVYFPDYTLPFTAAHELSHQRGIARENEANFIAFLVTKSADDAYIRYSGSLNMLEYVANALYRTDAEVYREVMAALAPEVKGELRAYADFFTQFKDSAMADVSDAVNDTYLKLNGNEAGTASYGLVVELAVAYYHT